jgi:hypothetical protein
VNWIIFTAPNGEPLLIDLAEMNLVRRPLPTEKIGDTVGAAIFTGGIRMLIRETFGQVVDAMLLAGIKISWPDGTPVIAASETPEPTPCR